MSDIKARQLFQQFRQASSSAGTAIDFDELRALYQELRKEDGAKPADKFSAAGRELIAEVDGLDSADKGRMVGYFADLLSNHAERNAWDPVPPPAGGVIDIPAKNGHQVFLTPGAGFAVDAQGSAAASVGELGSALFDAGEWVQAGFGSGKNLFQQAGFENAGRLAVVEQFSATAKQDLSALTSPNRNQLLGNVAGLLVELIKSANINLPAPVAAGESREVVKKAFGLLLEVLNNPELSALIKRQLVAYLNDSDSFRGQLSGAQKTQVDDLHTSLNPKMPFDYDKWDAQGKDTIVVKHLAGGGEGFLYGMGKWLQESGLGTAQGSRGQLKASIVSGDWEDDRGPVKMKIEVPESSPFNKWGRKMTVEIELTDFRDNMFEGLGDADVDITGYDGHSGFGRNTLRSLPNAPDAQVGDKLLYRFVCAGMDVENAIAHRYPEAFVNSYTTQDSGYFWTQDRPAQHGGQKYAYRAEGWMAFGNMIMGVLAKDSHQGIQNNMGRYANMARHSPGNDNNFVGPGDPRRGGSGDWDGDGVANMYDVMPTVNTFDVAADAAKDFDLSLPAGPANKIKGGRAFDAVHFVDTATNYSSLLKQYNLNRAMTVSPDKAFFDGADDPNTYVRFERRPGAGGQNEKELFVQLNSALADMTIESLRAVLYFETSKFLLADNNTSVGRDPAKNTAAALMFAASSLEYDMGWRDAPVFEGLKKLYGIPDEVEYSTFRSALSGAETRHEYSGDTTALNAIMAAHGDALARPGVGEPAITVG